MQPLTDGLLVLRHLFGFTGATLTGGALGDGCTRCLAADITELPERDRERSSTSTATPARRSR